MRKSLILRGSGESQDRAGKHYTDHGRATALAGLGTLPLWYTTCTLLLTTHSIDSPLAPHRSHLRRQNYARVAGKLLSARGHVGWERCEFCPVLRACYQGGTVSL